MVHAETEEEVNIMTTDREHLEQFKTAMFEALRRTRETKVEHGFNVCKVNDELIMSEICKGDKCSVALTRCQWPNTFLEFHSHPPGHGVLMSPHDIFATIVDHSEYFCIGVSKGPRTKKALARCYKVNNESELTGKFARAFNAVEYSSPDNPENQKNMDIMRGIIVDIIAGQSDMMKKEIQWEETL
jgi:hypothetical protein